MQSDRMLRLATAALVLACLPLSTAFATFISQGAGDTFLAWEAENFASKVDIPAGRWDRLDDAAASAGVTLISVKSGDNPPAPGNGMVTYGLKFDTAGTYRLYFRRNSPTVGSDSMYRPVPPDITSVPGGGSGVPVSAGYEWRNDSRDYVIAAGDVGTVLDCTFGTREANLRLDRIVLSTNTALSSAQLDALANGVVTRTWDDEAADDNWSSAVNWTGDLEPAPADKVLFEDAGAAAAVGTVTNVVDTARTIAGLEFRNTTGNAHTTDLGGNTLVVDGDLAVNLDVLGQTTQVAMTNGTLQVGATGTNTADIDIGVRTEDSAAIGRASLDLSGTSAVTFNADALRIGVIAIGVGGGQIEGILTLSQAGTNTINANSIVMGDTEWAFNYQDVDHALHLGGGANVINTDSLTVGKRKADATLDMAAGGTLTLTGLSGAEADLFVGDCNVGTGAAVKSVMDLSGGTFNAALDQVVLGRYGNGGGYSTGTLEMDAGTVNADSVLLAKVVNLTPSATPHPENTKGTLTMRGGTFTVGGNVVDGGGTSTLDILGGTLDVGGDLSVDHLRVGYNMRDGKVSAGGAVSIGASGDLDIGVRDVISNDKTTGELDLAAADSVWLDVDRLHVGVITARMGSGSVTGTGEAQGILTLSQSGKNEIHAGSIVIGDTEWAFNYQTVDHALHLGGAQNDVRTDSLTVGGRKADATLDIAAGGTLDLRGPTGADEADLFVGDCDTPGTGATVNSVMDLGGGTFDASLGQVVLGRYGSGSGYSTGTLVMDAGTVAADSIDLARVTGSASNPQNTKGTLTMRGGDFTVSGSVTDGGGTSTLDILGGTLTVGGDVTVDNLRVGMEAHTGKFVAGAGSTVTVAGGALLVGCRGSATSTTTRGELDLSAATTFTADVPSLTLGQNTTSWPAGGGGQTVGIVKLAGTNTITANTVTIGNSNGAANTTYTSQLVLGDTNTLHTDTLYVGRRKSRADVHFADGGTLTLDGKSGARADLLIAYNDTGTGITTTGTMDLSGGAFNAMLDNLVLGLHGTTSGHAEATLVIDEPAGATTTVDVNNIRFAEDSGTNPHLTTGTLTFRGGTIAAGSVAKGPGKAIFDWTGGTLHVDSFGFDLFNDDPANPGAGTGTLAPGRSIGTTHVAGSYTQGAAATLEIEIDGALHDLVTVDALATLDGTLEVKFLGAPIPSHLYDVLVATGGIDDQGMELQYDDPMYMYYSIVDRPDVGQAAQAVRLHYTPEPGTISVLLLGLVPLARRRRRKHATAKQH